MKAAEIQQRREKILDILKNTHVASVRSLMTQCKVSDETIRKDLHYLAQQGLVKKKFGKAFFNADVAIVPVAQRTNFFSTEKNQIAQRALKLIPASRITIALDQGSTVAALAQQLNKFSNKTIFTSSLLSLIELKGTQNEVYCLGGRYSKNDMSFQSNNISDLYTKMHFDVCFIGSSGVLGRNGICSSTLADAEMKRKMIQSSDLSIALIDSSKFKRSSLIEVVDWQTLDYVITNLPSDDPNLFKIKQQCKLILL